MSGKILTAIAAAILLASTGLASAHDPDPSGKPGYPVPVTGQSAATSPGSADPDPSGKAGYPVPVTGQSAATSSGQASGAHK